jgi:hypothetical protein
LWLIIGLSVLGGIILIGVIIYFATRKRNVQVSTQQTVPVSQPPSNSSVMTTPSVS